MREIAEALEGWAPNIETYHLYELWSVHRILPFNGGYLEQPKWVLDLFRKAALWDEFIQLNDKLPDAAGLPVFGE